MLIVKDDAEQTPTAGSSSSGVPLSHRQRILPDPSGKPTIQALSEAFEAIIAEQGSVDMLWTHQSLRDSPPSLFQNDDNDNGRSPPPPSWLPDLTQPHTDARSWAHPTDRASADERQPSLHSQPRILNLDAGGQRMLLQLEAIPCDTVDYVHEEEEEDEESDLPSPLLLLNLANSTTNPFGIWNPEKTLASGETGKGVDFIRDLLRDTQPPPRLLPKNKSSPLSATPTPLTPEKAQLYASKYSTLRWLPPAPLEPGFQEGDEAFLDMCAHVDGLRGGGGRSGMRLCRLLLSEEEGEKEAAQKKRMSSSSSSSSSSSRLGWVPRDTKKGDRVYVVLGCRMPVVLRPEGRGEGFELVGGCWVRGLMGGEAVLAGRERERILLV